jgi:hypothetical protein
MERDNWVMDNLDRTADDGGWTAIAVPRNSVRFALAVNRRDAENVWRIMAITYDTKQLFEANEFADAPRLLDDDLVAALNVAVMEYVREHGRETFQHEVSMKAAREDVRGALNIYRQAIIDAQSEADGSAELEDLHASLTQVESAKRVLWFEDRAESTVRPLHTTEAELNRGLPGRGPQPEGTLGCRR